MRRCLAACVGILILTISARADVPEGTPALRGTLISIDAGTGVLQVGTSDGQQQGAVLALDAVVVIAHPLPRAALVVGQTVAVNADDIPLPQGRLLAAGIYLQADPSVTPDDREPLLRAFLPASGPGPAPHRIVCGRLLSLEGTWLEIGRGNEVIRVKLTPEANGQRLQFGQRSDLRQGTTVTMALLPGGAHAVLVEE